MRRIPVLFLEPTLIVGGAERVLEYVVTRLDREHFRPVVCCLKGPGPIGEKMMNAGIPVYHNLLVSRYSFGVLPKLVSLMRREDIQVIHTINQPLTAFWGAFAGLLAGRPAHITTVHSTRTTVHRGRGRFINRVVASQIDAIVAITNAHRDYLVSEEGMDPDKVHVIPNGIDISRFGGPTRLRRSDVGLPEGVPVVGVVAMLRPEKAHDNFLRATPLVLKTLPSAHFAIIGDGPERERLEAMTRSLGLERQVHFLGRRDDIEQVLPLIDLSVLPSRNTETFPLSILESMAAGRPVVVTDVGSLRDMVTEGINGLIVPRENVTALASAINLILTNPDLAQQMGTAGRERSKRFSDERMVRSMEELFLRLVEAKRTGHRLTVSSQTAGTAKDGA